MRAWRCVADDEPLLGGDHGPYLSDVLDHLRAAHPGQPVDAAFVGFRARFGEERKKLTEPHAYEQAAARPSSIAAARKALGGSGSARARVLAAIVSSPRTDEELQADLAMPANTQRPRRKECEDYGWVEDSGERRATAAGVDAIVWRVTAEGLALLAAAP